MSSEAYFNVVETEGAVVFEATDYDLSGDCEPDCSCYRTECPELFCTRRFSLLPIDFLRREFPQFTNYCQCGTANH